MLGPHLPVAPAVLTVLRAFPCRSRLGDAETAAATEEEVRMARVGGSGFETSPEAAVSPSPCSS